MQTTVAIDLFLLQRPVRKNLILPGEAEEVIFGLNLEGGREILKVETMAEWGTEQRTRWAEVLEKCRQSCMLAFSALVREGRVLNNRHQPDHVLSQIPMPES